VTLFLLALLAVLAVLVYGCVAPAWTAEHGFPESTVEAEW
jgi:hypothetical protein